MMVNVFIKLLNISFSASLLILACIIIRFAFKKMPKYLRCILWVLVLIRLVCPLHLESPFSVLPKKDLISREVVVSDVSEDSSRLEERNHIGQSENITDMSENDSIIYLQNDTSANYPETVEIQSKDNLIQNNNSNYSKFLNQTSIFKLLSVIWVLGVLGSIGYGVVAYIRLKKCVSTAVRLKDNIFQTENIESPFVLGLFKAKIYIPYNLSPTEIFFVLSHEKSHIARKDHLLKPFAYAVACVYWFNPLVWLGYVLLCRDIELACDEKAVNLIGYNKKKAYSQSILDFSVPKKYISACPVAFGETGVKERVKSVLSMKKHKKIAVVAGVAIIALTAIGFLTYPKVNAEKSDTEEIKTAEELNEENINEKTIDDTATVGNAEDKQSDTPNENRSLTIKYLYLDVMGGEPYTIARGFSEEHEGIDFAAQEGTSVYNACIGTVSDVGYDDSRGNYIEICSEDGKTFIYDHLKDTAIPVVGSDIKSGMKIGEVGNTGNSTGPHLHYAVKDENGEYINPEEYIIVQSQEDTTIELTEEQELSENESAFEISFDDNMVILDAKGKTFKNIKEFIDAFENTFKANNEFREESDSQQAVKQYTVKDFEIEEPFNGKTLSGEISGWYNYGTHTVLGPIAEHDLSQIKISKGFSKDHKGLDIAVEDNDSIYTTYSGQVDSIGYAEELGNYIKIKTLKNLSITYYHLKSMEDFEVGDVVTWGTKIGEGGTVSDANNEPHIHMTVTGQDDEYLDPTYFLTNHSIEMNNEELGDQVWIINTDSGVVIIN